jgi:magnesium transporter
MPYHTKYQSKELPRFTFYSDKSNCIHSDSFEQIKSPNGESIYDLIKSTTFWLDICRPELLEMEMLSQIFNIHPLTVEDIQDNDPREKCEIFDPYIFLCIRTCDQDVSSEGFLEPSNLYIIVFSNCILSIHSQPMDHIGHVIRRIERSGMPITSDWVMYALLDDIVDSFKPNINTTELEVDSIDDLVLVLTECDQSDMIRRIGRARKRVTTILRLLNPKTEVVKALVKRNAHRLNVNTIVYLRDIQDHLLSMCQSLDHFSETLNTSHSNYLAQISIELTQASNRMNHVVKKLTVAAAVFLPLTLYAGK